MVTRIISASDVYLSSVCLDCVIEFKCFRFVDISDPIAYCFNTFVSFVNGSDDEFIYHQTMKALPSF